ncbi:MAG: hypothetical protein Q8O19_00175 [Rectinemataceae bacterium]|nr:hypothetical protein [Rectinemataceae bacterium]
MKPLGMTPFFQIVTPTSEENKIWETVSDLISAGWTPEQFKAEAAEAWAYELERRAKHAKDVFNK